MIQPAEMRETRPMKLHGGVISSTTDVWNMLTAAQNGDLAGAKAMVERCPALVGGKYDYTSPLHLAVREGHLELVHYLVKHGGLDPADRNHPFMEPLVVAAEDRGDDEIAGYLKQSLKDPSLTHTLGDTGKIDFGKSELERRFQELVDQGRHIEVEAMLKERPELALDEVAFWGEGILSMPANGQDFQMIELLMQYGACIPEISKWPKEYYFKHYKCAAFLMKHGMSPNHMNWRHVTLLHDMAHTGQVDKARLLLDHGAEINPVDEEYRSTPLGYAARWGRQELVDLLLQRGADPNLAGAGWATPLAWARKKGHPAIEAVLRKAGAVK
jgi:uncharacterized protein